MLTDLIKDHAFMITSPKQLTIFVTLPGILMLTGCFFLQPLAAEEEENSGALNIESKTDELSADIHIAKEEGKKPPRSEADDRARDKIGAGEVVTLTLTGKPDLIGDITKLKWSRIEGKNLADFIKSPDGSIEVKFQASPYITQGGKLTIQATTSTGLKKTIEFNVVLPDKDVGKQQKVTALHAKDPKTGKRGFDENRFDAWPTEPGCGAKLEITLHPTDVSFKKLEILETHLQNIPDPLPEIADEHRPLEIGTDVNVRNGFIDNIGSLKSWNKCKDLTKEWSWISKFSTSQYSKPIVDITTPEQHFKFEWSAPNEEGVIITVTKFGREVRRMAIKAIHYKPSRKPETLTQFL